MRAILTDNQNTYKAPPTITSISPNNVNILEGRSFQITCQADGYPTPMFEVSQLAFFFHRGSLS